jgi:hypothetical protein
LPLQGIPSLFGGRRGSAATPPYPADFIWLDPGGDAVEAFGYFNSIANNGSGCSYDTSVKFQGVGSYKFDAGAGQLETDAANKIECLNTLGTRFSVRWRYSVQPSPAGQLPIIYIANTLASSGKIFAVTVTPSGAGVKVQFSGFATLIDGTTVLAVNTWYRISFAFVLHAADNLDVKIYVDGNQEVSTTGEFTNGRDVATAYYYGWGASPGANTACWYDQFVIDNGSDLSDLGAVLDTAKLPTSANANNFDTTGGTGAVDERPPNLSNYKQQQSSSQVSQNYNLQAAATGDIDISSKTIYGYMGWIIANEGATSGTPKITVDGTDYAVTLTSSALLYAQCNTPDAYPSNAAAIGMVSSGTADDTALFECGVVVAYKP